ncbi:hypothetical protein LIER_29292 [Lithospermum erythrorhizon]|uniref:Uncharacterized protein n=1 Tax=Lithospermum erythrorhizon TaxID=34254 RepID=A0AAV3RIP7_LITER
MTALQISGEEGAGPTSSVFVPSLTCPATHAERASTHAERASTCRCKATIASVRGAGATASRVAASWRLRCPCTGSFSLHTGGI